MSQDLADVRKRLALSSPPWLVAHCERVATICVELARRFGADQHKAELVALLHDVARAKSEAELLSLAKTFHLKLDKVEQSMPLLAHGRVAAELLARDWGIHDAEILEAVRSHTTGAEGMSLLAKVLFLGDKLESWKMENRPGLEKVEELAKKDIDRAILEFYNWQIASLVSQNALLHPKTIEARNELVMRMGLNKRAKQR